MKSLSKSRERVEFRCDDPNLTPAAGLAAVAELDRVLGIIAEIDEQVGSLYRAGARYRSFSAGEVVMGLCESQLSGGDFLCDIDYRRADDAGSSLRAVSRPPASTTVGYLARRFGDKQVAGLEAAVGILARRMIEILPDEARARLLAGRPTIDLDPTDVEVYGKKKRGVAFNYAGQLTGRPHPAIFAEAGLVLAADLGSGTDDPRPQAPSLIARAVGALPVGLGAPIVRGDSGFFDTGVAEAALTAGADFAIAAKRNPALWRKVREVPPDAWVRADAMDGAEVAECSYLPAGWPPETRAVVRRVRVEAEEIRADPRSRRRRTIDPEELKAVKAGTADHAFAYVVILTSLSWSVREIEAWFRDRAQVEERLKDSKLGLSLRHLPSGYPEVNAVWMWAAFLALNVSATLSAFAGPPRPEDDELVDDPAATSNETEGTDTEHGDGTATPAPGPCWSRQPRPHRAHAKRLRREIIMVPGRIAHHARRLVVHLHPSELAGPMLTAYGALLALPSFAGP
ncbi:MAG: transposase [Actinomycetota bacterium]|nr:transposase [Actinomycetota bacterium]